MANPAEDWLEDDVRKCGSLRKCKSLHRRFFVLRAASERGAARLEYYESEKKFRARGPGGGGGGGGGGGAGGSGAGAGGAGAATSPAPKRALPLNGCLNVNKRADSRCKYLLALYTRDTCLAVAADSPQEQDSWYRAILQLITPGTGPTASSTDGDSNYALAPGPAFKEVWQVNLRPRGLGQSRNMNGIYRLCLTDKTISLVKLNSDTAAVVLQLMNIRRCGHSDNFFFVEVGRSAVTGPGEFWMQVDDSVVAQNMHETILEAMKAMSEEFRLRSKSQSSSSNPISVPIRRYHLASLPPSQVGFSARRPGATSPAQRCNSVRARTSSDGSAASSSSSSRPPSADEVPASPSLGAGLPSSRPGSSRAHPTLGQTRSTPDPSTRRSPCSATGLAFSLTADRGFSSPSPSSSPPSSSDGEGEFGTSPAHFPLEGTPQDYVALCSLAPAAQEVGAQQKRVLRRACSQGEEEMGERGVSKRAWAGKGSWRASRTPEPSEGGCKDFRDNGYMAMSPGMVSGPCQVQGGDYVAMTLKGASAPQQILGPHPDGRCGGGYMLMSPSGSCSPESWARAVNRKLEMGDGISDYMNMSPGSRSASSTPPESPRIPLPPRAEEGELADSLCHGFRSLPRSYKQPAPATAPAASSGQLSSSSSSSSTDGSSDSLGEAEGRRPSSATPAAQQPPRPGRKALCRPACLSIDVAKAKTLPRHRDSPDPQSPGEYVSIEFRAETTVPRSGPCASMFQHPPCPATEYINMEPSQVSAKEHIADPSPKGTYEPVGMPELSPDPHQEARVICADPQGRRRHCSETFLPAPLPSAPSADHVRCRGSASFENVWPTEGGSAEEEPCTGMSRHMSIGFENGLNYIDLDLGTDSSHTELPTLQQRLYTPASAQTYASIDFHKSEELRSHKTNKEDC
ncbi:insulin receptor substrate 1-B-like [Amblyraja radiata]|uniref:insulin receptor substrate 1-B-like n=1 Tax=Amblyraja radiata TaxID=386614 RepID=UPI001403AA4C|nr:insulin receptor substrate 1-B-like [Amblyraja radiata]